MQYKKNLKNQMRRNILEYLLERYDEDALCPVSFFDIVKNVDAKDKIIVTHLRYLENSGFIKVSWNMSGTGLVRLQNQGVDVAEDYELLDKLFPVNNDNSKLELNSGGEKFIKLLEQDENISLRDKLQFIEMARDVFSEVHKVHKAGIDFYKIYNLFNDLRAAMPQMRVKLEDSLKTDNLEAFDTWKSDGK